MSQSVTRVASLSLSILAVFALVLVATAPARAAEPGVVPDLTWYIPDSDKERTAEALREMGSRWVRLHVQWREAEPQRGQLNEWWMREYDKAISIARDAGQKIVVMVSEAPAWASGSPSHNVPRDPADYASFMKRFAERFRGRVEAYEIWNEQNIKRFWSTGPNPAEYVKLLKASAQAVREADPAAKVVFGGLSTNDWEYLSKAYEAGARGTFDVLATHPYTYCGSSDPEEIRRTSGGRITRDSFFGYRELRRVMRENGDEKPIWFTEFGWTTTSKDCNPGAGQWQGGVTEQQQARLLTKAYELIEQDPYVEVAIWYNLRNNYWSNDADDPEARFGLLRTDYSPKPAFHAFAAYAHGEPAPHLDEPEPIDTRTSLNVAGPRHKPIARGRVDGATQGKVRLLVERKPRKGKGWRPYKRVAERLNGGGRYKRRLRLRPGVYRIVARFQGTRDRKPSRSRFKRVRAH